MIATRASLLGTSPPRGPGDATGPQNNAGRLLQEAVASQKHPGKDKPGVGDHQPNSRAAFSLVARATSSTDMSFTTAIASATCETYAGSFGRPRFGAGVRNGASVSTTIRSSGVM